MHPTGSLCIVNQFCTWLGRYVLLELPSLPAMPTKPLQELSELTEDRYDLDEDIMESSSFFDATSDRLYWWMECSRLHNRTYMQPVCHYCICCLEDQCCSSEVENRVGFVLKFVLIFGIELNVQVWGKFETCSTFFTSLVHFILYSSVSLPETKVRGHHTSLLIWQHDRFWA